MNIHDVDIANRAAIEKTCTQINLLGDIESLWIESLSGGITNRNYRLTGAGRSVVLRVHGTNTDLLGIDRSVEHFAACQAADLGIGPAVVGLIEPERYLVTEFLEATPADLTDPHVFQSTIESLAKWHASAPIPGRFDTFGLARTYAHIALDHGITLPIDVEAAIELSVTVGLAFASIHDPLVPCHNDLLAANFLQDLQGRVWLIDWEYAGMNTRWFDLGNFSINNGFDREKNDELLSGYFGTCTDQLRARLTLMRVMSDVREAMWGVAQQGISTLDFDYFDYARQHFHRMMMNSTTSAFRNALQIAGTP
jgi:thiamine kinase-like enzyme